jgi:hypothetical protein
VPVDITSGRSCGRVGEHVQPSRQRVGSVDQGVACRSSLAPFRRRVFGELVTAEADRLTALPTGRGETHFGFVTER